jgi:uncharacterized sulfatase
MKPERWPSGAPQRIKPGTENELLPMYGLDKEGKHNSEWAFTDIDASPSKSFIIENWRNENIKQFFDYSLSKRPDFELFDVHKDPFCLKNLAGKQEYSKVENEMYKALSGELKKSEDPRIVGPDREVFDSYLRYSPMREFPPK